MYKIFATAYFKTGKICKVESTSNSVDEIRQKPLYSYYLRYFFDKAEDLQHVDYIIYANNKLIAQNRINYER